MTTIEQLRTETQRHFDELEKVLMELVAIPSVSSAIDTTPVHDSAEYVSSLLRDLGVETEILTAPTDDGTQGMPAVVGRKHVSDDAPTVLLYAHHDVQPAGSLEAWKSEPFTAVRKGERLYGRGTSDDGAGIIVHLGALRVLGDMLPCNIVVFIEGEEEIGSPSFKNFLKKYRDKLIADRIVVADADNWKVGQPSVTTSLRGVVTMDVSVSVLKQSLHSGMYGGPIIDAVTLASRLIATLHDDAGDVAVEGLGGSNSADVDYPEADLRADTGLLEGVKLTGTGDIAARLWTKPSISVIGWDQRDLTTASNTLTPTTTFRLSLRVVPGVSPEQSAQALAKHLVDHAPFGAKVETTVREMGPSYQAKERSRATDDEMWALEAAWSVPATHIGCGGSIPFISDFAEFFPEAEVVVTGVEDPATNAHSENESQHMGDLKNAILAEALFLMKTAGVSLA
ncbi:MAG: M20/M25/M40 family metallo-hydrolase [Actinomycetaceae bacterium]|nr:M20/M25/M40 family metallo-hydrolase [Actinomycetaceae bacterium]